MGFFTARNRQNPFAERRRAQRKAEAEAETAAILSDPDTMEAVAEAEAEKPVPVAVPVDLNPDSAEYTQAPDISKFAEGGIVELPDTIETVPDEVRPELVEIAKPMLSPETQAKIDAVMSHAIPPVVDEQPAETPAAEPESDAKRGRGRPRPQETIDRDNAVHELLKAADAVEGVSKEALAISLGEKEQQVYSSLRQLTKEGRAETRYVKPHGYRWFAV